MGRSSTRHKREIYCVDAAGETPDMHGEIGNDPCPGAYNPVGSVKDGSTLAITFGACVAIDCAGGAVTGIEYRVNTDSPDWTQVAGCTTISGTEYEFDTTPTVVQAGDVVEWRYVGGSGTIVDCNEAEDVGDLGPIILNNPLVLAGGFVLLETGGADIALVEDDTDDTAGIQLEDADEQ